MDEINSFINKTFTKIYFNKNVFQFKWIIYKTSFIKGFNITYFQNLQDYYFEKIDFIL